MTSRSFLVTGASTGIGRSCVDGLVRSGAHVWATVRTSEDEDALRRDYPEAVTVLRMDVTDDASVRAAGERVLATGPLHGLVNNAGVALPGPLEHIPIEVFRRQIEVNLIGQLTVTQAMLPALRQSREQGQNARIVMVGSIAGRIAGPMLGPYHASKHGLLGLADSLRAELAPSGIPVVLIEPGAIATPIWNRGAAAGDEVFAQFPAAGRERYAAQIADVRATATRAAAHGLPPERVAQVIVTALTGRHPRPRYLVGRDAQAAAMVARLPFRLRYRLTAAKR
ncbi:MAG: SDR family oxidoreductase [Actinobacteria bacterium]|nr:SDR family oxidoreductase [Actinomycetota bacterium]MBI3686724.1 SDR family oxidoreductase [Actinomycetota bacterium]